jgi:8-oxo-dGTP pyrophosphatase MutT (NUDIX family)
MKTRSALHQRLFLYVVQRSHRWRRAMTLGARVAVLDDKGRVLLVRHTYAPGWNFPGGGVEFGESCEDAARREIREEAGISAAGALELRGIFSNHVSYPGDHLAFFVLRQFTRSAWKPNREIAEAEFFPMDQMPDNTTGGTLRRVAEIKTGQPPSANW